MIRAFVALSLIVLGLLFYAIKDGNWPAINDLQSRMVSTNDDHRSNQDTVKEAKAKSEARIKEIQKTVEAKRTGGDDLGFQNQDAKASADISQLKEQTDVTDASAAKLQQHAAALVKQAKEDKAVAAATEVRLKQETDEAIQTAKREALKNAAAQIDAKITEVQAQANEKIEKTQSLLEDLKKEKQKLASKNEELEKIQLDAQHAADTAAEAAQNAQIAARKTAEILGSRNADDTAVAAPVVANKHAETLASSQVIHSVEDAKRVVDSKIVANLAQLEPMTATNPAAQAKKTTPAHPAAATISNASALNRSRPVLQKAPVLEQKAPVASIVTSAPTGATEKDPITGFPVSYGYSTYAGGKATILFSFDSYALSDSARIALTKQYAAAKLKGSSLLVTGFSDGAGSKASQQRISAARTKAVKDFLLALGASEDKITAKTTPDAYACDNTTAQGRMLNRRVAVVLR